MKVFGCEMQGGYAGGIVLVAANTKEQAFEVSGRGTWGNNPWVFVYEFELVK